MDERKCPFFAAGCAECAMLEEQQCMIKRALRSLPAIAEKLDQLGWIERVADVIEDVNTNTSLLDIEDF